jgi:hypothetical protein
LPGVKLRPDFLPVLILETSPKQIRHQKRHGHFLGTARSAETLRPVPHAHPLEVRRHRRAPDSQFKSARACAHFEIAEVVDRGAWSRNATLPFLRSIPPDMDFVFTTKSLSSR